MFSTLTQPQQKQSRSFRLVQISDCHLSANPVAAYRGVSSDAGLVAVIKAVANWRPDAVMLTGDLSEDGSEASYRRLAEHIAPLNVPVFALPGNHDVPELMQPYFPHGPYQGACVEHVGDWKLLLLNSARPRRIEGSIDPGDLLQVQQYLQGDSPAVLALHHQPIAIGAAWIDKYRLDQPDGLLACVADHPRVKAVVWGHVHQAFETQIGSARFLSAPSSAANSLPASPRFTLDPAGPAFRWLELFTEGRPGGCLETGIIHAM